MSTLPIVVIAWNNLFFVKRFIAQLLRLPNPIIILDNNSEYTPLLDYYGSIKQEIGDRIDIRRLDQNYGHKVYQILGHTLPDVYILSDPDLQLNQDMPINVGEQLLRISNRYRSGRIGLALDISDHAKFIDGSYGRLVYSIESGYYRTALPDPEYQLYRAPTDTTFCLINRMYNESIVIRVGGVFTAKHLPWYNNYLKENIPKDELAVWIKNNKSSSILGYINANELLS
jgi:hypothetical protein